MTFKEHIAKTARSCRFALHNIRKIRPFLTQHAAQLIVQALVISRLDYCNALLAGLSSNTNKPLQIIQNAAARLVFCETKRAHVTPLFISLHWLPVAARIKFKALMLAYRTATDSAPSYFHSLITIFIPSRSLRSASERSLMVPSQRGTKSLSRTFLFTVPGWWKDLPTPIRNAESLTPSSDTWKLISSIITWLHLKKKKMQIEKTLSFLNFALFPLTPHCLARISSEQCLDICITSTSCVCLPLYNVSLIVFLNCKSLWIKASAKLINLNVILLKLHFSFKWRFKLAFSTTNLYFWVHCNLNRLTGRSRECVCVHTCECVLKEDFYESLYVFIFSQA